MIKDNIEKRVYTKPRLIKYESVQRLTKAWNVGSEDGDSGRHGP